MRYALLSASLAYRLHMLAPFTTAQHALHLALNSALQVSGRACLAIQKRVAVITVVLDFVFHTVKDIRLLVLTNQARVAAWTERGVVRRAA